MSYVRFLVSPDPARPWSDPLRRRGAVRRSRRILRRRAEPFVLMRVGGEPLEASYPRDLSLTINRLDALLAKEQVGQTYKIASADENEPVLRVRVIEMAPEPVPTPGIPAIDRFVGYLNDMWPNWRNGGICVCKYTSPGNWSDHAYCGAIDVFDTPEHMEAIRDFAVHNAAEFDITYVIYQRSLWSRSGGWQAYTGTTHYHVHVSFEHGPERLAC